MTFKPSRRVPINSYPPAVKSAAIRAYLAGVLSCREIAKASGISLSTLTNWTKGLHGQRKKRTIPALGVSKQRRAVAMYNDKIKPMGARQIARKLGPGISVQRVLQWVRAAGHRPRGHGCVPRIDAQQAADAYTKLGVTKAAALLGCTTSAIYRARERWRLETMARARAA